MASFVDYHMAQKILQLGHSVGMHTMHILLLYWHTM